MNHTKKKLLVLAAGLVGAAGLASAGWAYWSTNGTGTAAGSVGTLNAPTNVSATATPGSGTVPVSWTASTTAAPAVTPTGYYVQRFAGATPSAACASSPSALIAGTTCNDASVADGIYTYRVTAVFHSWTARSTASSSVTVVNDSTPPTVSSISRVAGASNPTNANSVSWTVTFSENVTGVNTADFSLAQGGSVTGGSVSSVSGSGTTYTVTATTGTGDGTLGLNLVDNDTIVDGVSNKLGGTGTGNGNFTGQTYSIDKSAPYVIAINRAGANPTKATSVSWTVTFNESISGADSGDFSLAGTGASLSTISGASGMTFTVTASTGSDGSLGLNLVDNDTIVDAAGNKLGALLGGLNGDFTGEAYTIDKTAPTTSDNASSAWTNTAQTVTLSPSDSGSGVAATYYTTNGSIPTISSAQGTTIVLSAEGVYAIKYFSVDAAGNAEAVKTAANQVRIDKTAPSTTDNTASIGNGWKNTSQTVTLTPGDASGSGVAATYYTTDGSTPTTSSAQGSSVVLSVDGQYTVKYFSVDNVGNAEIVKTAATVIRIDKTTPTAGSITANSSASASVNSTGTISLAVTNFTDGGSGISTNQVTRASATLANNACGTLSGSSAVTIVGGNDSTNLATGCYQYTLAGTDAAGNQANAQSAIVKVDTTAATLQFTTTGTNVGTDGSTIYFKSGGSGTFTVTAVDADSGAASSTFPTITGWTQSGSGNARTYTLGAATASSSPTVSVINGVGTATTPQIPITVNTGSPTTSNVTTTDGDTTAGHIGAGDTLTLTFSRAMRPSSILSGWTGSATQVTVNVSSASPNVLTVTSPSGVNLGSVSLGSGNYVTANSFARWTDSTMQLGSDYKSVILTIGSTCESSNSTCATKVGTVTGNTTFIWTPSTSATDLAGIPMAATTKSSAAIPHF